MRKSLSVHEVLCRKDGQPRRDNSASTHYSPKHQYDCYCYYQVATVRDSGLRVSTPVRFAQYTSPGSIVPGVSIFQHAQHANRLPTSKRQHSAKVIWHKALADANTLADLVEEAQAGNIAVFCMVTLDRAVTSWSANWRLFMTYS